MPRVVGADGCKHGQWAAFVLDDAALSFVLASSTSELAELVRDCSRALIDIPIGLPDAGPRECDRRARTMLGPRRSSVFPAPTRGLLGCRSLAEADRHQRAITGRRVQRQMWNILPRIREVDEWLRADAGARRVVREGHPELCLTALQGQPMSHSKRTSQGRDERMHVLTRVHSGATDALLAARTSAPRSLVADDDLIDALTCALCAAGPLVSVPDPPPIDAEGLPMAMWMPPGLAGS